MTKKDSNEYLKLNKEDPPEPPKVVGSNVSAAAMVAMAIALGTNIGSTRKF